MENKKLISSNYLWLSIFLLYGFLNALFSLLSLHLGHIINLGNFSIFCNSFTHLINHQDLYTLYSGENTDYFKYSPTFALFMGLFAILPRAVGAFFWDLFITGVLAYALVSIKGVNRRTLFMLFIIVCSYGSLRVFQPNIVIAAIGVFFTLSLERGKTTLSAILIACAAFIKIYSVFPVILILFYPKLIKKFSIQIIIFGCLLLILPLVVVSVPELINIYKSWLHLLKADSFGYGLSMIGFVDYFFHLSHSGHFIYELIPLLMTVSFIVYLSRFKQASHNLVLNVLAFIFIYMVIFNHRAELQTYIIASIGVAIWFFRSKKMMVDTVLLLIIIALSLVTETRFVPQSLRDIIAYSSIQSFIYFVVWLRMGYALYKSERNCAL